MVMAALQARDRPNQGQSGALLARQVQAQSALSTGQQRRSGSSSGTSTLADCVC